MIFVIATITVDPAKRDNFLEAFAELTPTVFNEDGCLEYAASIDQPTHLEPQQLMGDSIVVVVEKWASVSALEAHLAASHMVKFRDSQSDVVRSISLQVLKPAC